MLRDITLGQFFPGKSILHRLDPRSKILFTIGFVILLFLVESWVGFVAFAVLVFLLIGMSSIPAAAVFRSIKPILPLILFTAVLNIFFVQGTVLWQWWILKISQEGVTLAIEMAVRIVLLIAGTSLLTYTTSPIALTDAIEQLLHPLKKVRFPVHEMAMMMTIALRFIPTLIDETDKIMAAQKARGADLETGNLLQRAKALIPILIPLFVSAFRRADELALAMECRCYRGDEGRTRMRQLRFGRSDIGALFFFAALVAVIVVCNLFLPMVV